MQKIYFHSELKKNPNKSDGKIRNIFETFYGNLNGFVNLFQLNKIVYWLKNENNHICEELSPYEIKKWKESLEAI